MVVYVAMCERSNGGIMKDERKPAIIKSMNVSVNIRTEDYEVEIPLKGHIVEICDSDGNIVSRKWYTRLEFAIFLCKAYLLEMWGRIKHGLQNT
jgi:hypothetical protein